MKHTSADSQNEAVETPPWPSVVRIAGEEFQQSVAVAQLAVRLCQLEMAKSKIPVQKENLDPKNFLAKAWELIYTAREHVLRSQTTTEYVVEQGGTEEALKNVVERTLRESYIAFERLCDPEHKNKEDTEVIDGISWKVYRSKHGFTNLFGDYWRGIGEMLVKADSAGGPLKLPVQGEVVVYPESDVQKAAKLARNTDAWNKRCEQVLNSWKSDGVRLADFLALAEFRKKRDNRAANLMRPKPTRKAPKR